MKWIKTTHTLNKCGNKFFVSSALVYQKYLLEILELVKWNIDSDIKLNKSFLSQNRNRLYN